MINTNTKKRKEMNDQLTKVITKKRKEREARNKERKRLDKVQREWHKAFTN